MRELEAEHFPSVTIVTRQDHDLAIWVLPIHAILSTFFLHDSIEIPMSDAHQRFRVGHVPDLVDWRGESIDV